jgi:hypothetical protein
MEEWKGELLLVKSHHVRVATLCIIFCFVKKNRKEEYAALFYNVGYFIIQEKERQNWEANLKSLRSKLEESENALVQMEIESAKAKSIDSLFIIYLINYINQ